MDYQKLAAEFDELIKNGQTQVCKQKYSELKLADIPRKNRVDFAKLALRLNLPAKAYQLLKNIIELDKQFDDHATDSEKLQFGMSLRQLGAIDFALKIFSTIDAKRTPEVLLYTAISYFNLWNYESSLPFLQKYTHSPSLTEQQRMIGLVNYAAALIHTENDNQALKTISTALEYAQKFNHQLIKANLFELWAQILINTNKLEEATLKLDEANQLINDDNSIYKLFIEKWKAILQLKKNPQSTEGMQRLDVIREKAIELKHWETIRDCDFYFATSKQDNYLFLRLFFGTSYEKYRQRLLKKMSQPTSIPSHFVWSGRFRFNYDEVTESNLIDITKNEIKIGKHVFDQFHLNALILKSLCSDFYAPIKPVSLYLKIFRNERLIPEEAIQRVFNAISKLNSLFNTEKIPLEVVSSDEGYRLFFKDKFYLKIPSELNFQDRHDFFYASLRKHFQNLVFSSTDVCDQLKLSKRTTIRYLKDAVDSGLIETEGIGSKLRYRFINKR